ncbi:MAG TPA: hypothetical protein VGN86_07590 [Pyrinomonadaceae bacterium]|jgi:hypothetical protein|nr:hypothetical protein [Pyrinomonadaceae bacterium]
MDNLSHTYAADLGESFTSPASQVSAQKRRFILALLVSTWVPLAFFITLGQFSVIGPGIGGIRSVLLFLSTAHVPATLFFYTDKEFAAIVRSNRARYIYFPLLLTVATGLLVAFSNPTTQAFVFLTFWGWQAFHYGRQNVGVYAFVSIAEKGRPASRLEKLAIDAGTICGILGTFKILGFNVAPAYLRGLLEILFQAGKYGLLLVVIFSVIVYLKNFQSTTLLKTIFYFTLVFFFVPIWLSDNINVTFLSYAIAHGLQYITFMSVVSLNSKADPASTSLPYRSIGLFLLFLLVVGFIFFRMEDLKTFEAIKNNVILMRSVDFAVGAILGATMAHFVIDAGAWRLSRVAQRAYMTKRFAFLLKPPKPEGNIQVSASGPPLS